MARIKLSSEVIKEDSFKVTDLFLGQVAHDLGNLLMPLLTYPQLLRMNMDADSPDVELVQGIEQASCDIEHTTRQIAALSTRNLEPMRRLDLSSLAVKALETTNSRTDENNAHVELHTSAVPVMVDGYADQMQAAIANLITNAADAAPGGCIDINIGHVGFDADRKVATGEFIPAGQWCYISVRDNGCGLEADAASRVFDPFYTTKKSQRPRGAGLGLCIVNRTQYLHNGYVDFCSAPGDGSCATLYYPVQGS